MTVKAVSGSSVKRRPDNEHKIQQDKDITLDIDGIITSGIRSLYQPIVNVTSGNTLGYECFSRGPDQHTLESPVELFREARTSNLLPSLETTCRELAIERFEHRGFNGSLFLHCNPHAFLDPDYPRGMTLQLLSRTSLSPNQVVIELTAQHFQDDFGTLRDALAHYRAMGFRTAIGGLGTSQDGLRLWSEIQPDFVKLDHHFTRQIDASPVKQAFVRSLVQLCSELRTALITTGVETAVESERLRDLGAHFQQGYLFARPSETPAYIEQPTPAPQRRRIDDQALSGDLASWVEPVRPEATLEAIWQQFEQHPGAQAWPIVTGGQKPIGLIHRAHLYERFAQPGGRELYSDRPVYQLVSTHSLVVPNHLQLGDLSALITGATDPLVRQQFIVVDHMGRYLGLGHASEVLRQLTESRIRVARHANPLTRFPGNVPINEKLEHLIEREQPFDVAYVDMDAFKPFNDTFGYHLGDQLILALSGLLQSYLPERHYFIGHIGGDDFMVITTAKSPAPRLRMLQHRFEATVTELMQRENKPLSTYQARNRDGQLHQVDLPRISIGVVSVHQTPLPTTLDTLAPILAAVKHNAKKLCGQGIATLDWQPL